MLAVQVTQVWVVALQAGVGPEQSPSPLHATQVLVVVLQWGVPPVHCEALVPVHWTQVLLPVLQAGVEPEQLESLVQARHWPFLQMPPVQVVPFAALVVPQTWFVQVFSRQVEDGAGQSAGALQPTHRPALQTNPFPQSRFALQATQEPAPSQT